MRLWTDYPFTFLGDVANEEAPVREVEAISYDQNKYVYVEILGTRYTDEIKSGYLYTKEGRYGEVPVVDIEYLETLPKTTYN